MYIQCRFPVLLVSEGRPPYRFTCTIVSVRDRSNEWQDPCVPEVGSHTLYRTDQAPPHLPHIDACLLGKGGRGGGGRGGGRERRGRESERRGRKRRGRERKGRERGGASKNM